MPDALFWIYFSNTVLLILHEIDSAYWREWELFRLPGGVTGFLLLHVPLLVMVLYGLIEVRGRSFAGLVLSLVLSCGGILAFVMHAWFIRQGRPEFNTAVSLFILAGAFILSLLQGVLTVQVLFHQ